MDCAGLVALRDAVGTCTAQGGTLRPAAVVEESVEEGRDEQPQPNHTHRSNAVTEQPLSQTQE